MSTILDALKKLQGERSSEDSTREPVIPKSPSTWAFRPRTQRWKQSLPALAVGVLAALGAWAFLRFGDDAADNIESAWSSLFGEERAPAEEERAPRQMAQRTPPPKRLTPPPRSSAREAGRAELKARQPSASVPPRSPGATPVPEQQTAGVSASRPESPAATRPVPRMPQPTEQRTVPGRPATPEPAPPPVPAAAPESPRPTPARAPATHVDPKPPSHPKPKVEPAAERQPAREVESAARSTAARAESAPVPKSPPARAATPAPSQPDSGIRAELGDELEVPIDFPSFTVSRIRWHPNPDRRVAFVELSDGARTELHEGDILAGAMVRRIDPDAVELAVGGLRRRLMLMP